jgi:hypothetical protein
MSDERDDWEPIGPFCIVEEPNRMLLAKHVNALLNTGHWHLQGDFTTYPVELPGGTPARMFAQALVRSAPLEDTYTAWTLEDYLDCMDRDGSGVLPPTTGRS